MKSASQQLEKRANLSVCPNASHMTPTRLELGPRRGAAAPSLAVP